MKPVKRKLASSLALLVLLSAAQLASAFYDPSLGRWINRDRIDDAELLTDGPNLYEFVRNEPTIRFDRVGTQSSIATVGGAVTVAEAEAAAAGYSSVAAWQAAKRAAALAAAIAEAKCRIDKEKKRKAKCNEIWFAQDAVCDQLHTPAAKKKCHDDNQKELVDCLNNKGGKYEFDLR